MKLKIRILSRITSANKFLIIVMTMLIVATMGSAISGCTPPQETRQLIIISELEPEAVLPFFGGDQYDECVYEVGKDTDICRVIQHLIEVDELGRDFVKGYSRGYWIYTLKSGKDIGVVHTLLDIDVLKYETLQAAEEAFGLFSERIDLKDLVFNKVKIKGAEGKDHPKGATYMLQSNNFVIYLSGDIEAGRDAVSRIIELYSVPLNKDHS